jgi:serine/threonine-protein kinase
MKDSRIDKDFTLDIINRLTFFKRFSQEEKKKLVQFHRYYAVYSNGELVIEEGAHGDSFFIVLSGNANVTKGKSLKSIAKIQPGDIIGEISFLTKGPRTATVTAEEDLIVIRVDETMLEQLGPVTREKFKDNFIEMLIERLKQMNEKLIA